MTVLLLLPALLAAAVQTGAADRGVTITEIGNNGSRHALYTGGDYVELLVTAEEGVTLAGWVLTDLSSPTGTPKENEGSVRFSDAEGSVFRTTLKRGTVVLVCLGERHELYGAAAVEEDASTEDGNDRIVVFAYGSPAHMTAGEGTVRFTGKDNIALLTGWVRDAAVSVVTWGGSSSWTGSTAAQLAQEMLENGRIAVRTADGAGWTGTADPQQASPGVVPGPTAEHP